MADESIECLAGLDPRRPAALPGREAGRSAGGGRHEVADSSARRSARRPSPSPGPRSPTRPTPPVLRMARRAVLKAVKRRRRIRRPPAGRGRLGLLQPRGRVPVGRSSGMLDRSKRAVDACVFTDHRRPPGRRPDRRASSGGGSSGSSPITPRRKTSAPTPAGSKTAGIPLRVDRSPFHMHHKFATFDGLDAPDRQLQLDPRGGLRQRGKPDRRRRPSPRRPLPRHLRTPLGRSWPEAVPPADILTWKATSSSHPFQVDPGDEPSLPSRGDDPIETSIGGPLVDRPRQSAALMIARRPWRSPSWRVGREPPPPEVAADPLLVRGREIYLDRCASCHGPSGRGDGPLCQRA